MWVQSVGREDTLEEGMATRSMPGESHGQRSLGSPSDRTDATQHTYTNKHTLSLSESLLCTPMKRHPASASH